MSGLELVDVLVQPALADHPAQLLDDAAAAGVRRLFAASVDAARSIALAHPSVDVVRGVGLLPGELAASERSRGEQVAEITQLLDDDSVRFLGEVGLDRRPGMPPLDVQQRALEPLLAAAAARSRPVLLHVVRAHGALLDVLERADSNQLSLAVHGYTGAAAAAEDLCRRGLYISFGPGLLNPDAKRAQDAARVVPDAHLLVESDAPTYLPSAIVEVVGRLATLRDSTPDAIARLTAANAARWLGDG